MPKLTTFQQGVETAIREVLGDLLQRGRATLTTGLVATDPRYRGIRFALRPTDPAACPVDIDVDGLADEYIWIFLGRSHATMELYPKMPEKISTLRSALGAVVAGRYDEIMNGGQVRGRFLTEEGPMFVSTNTLIKWRPESLPEGWQHITYAPYDKSDEV